MHLQRLNDNDITWHEGIRIVTPATAIRQGVNAKLPKQLLRQAIETAKKRDVPRAVLVD